MKLIIEGMEWAQHGELMVPMSSSQSHQINRYVTIQVGWSDIQGERGELGRVIELVEQLPQRFWLRAVAALTSVLDRENTLEIQGSLVETFAPDAYAERLRRLIREPNSEGNPYCLFTPRPLASLAKLALTKASGKEITPVWKEVFVAAYLMLCDYLEDLRRDEGDPFRNVLRFAVQEFEYGSSFNPGESLIRLDLLLNRIPKKVADRTGGIIPADIFEVATGMNLTQFMAGAMAVVAMNYEIDYADPASIEAHLYVHEDRFFSKTGLDGGNVRRFFDHLVLPKAEVKKLRNSDPTTANYFYDFGVLRQYPLLKDGPRYFPIIFPFFRWRITEGLYWDVRFATKRQEKLGLNVDELKFMSVFGTFYEAYVVELIERALPSAYGGKLERRLWADVQMHPQAPQYDLILAYPDAFVLIEVKASRYHYMKSIIAGDLDHIEKEDLRQMLFEPAKQIDRAISYFQSGQVSLEGRRYNGEVIYPVLITYESLPTMGLWEHLLQKVYEQGYLQQPNVRPLVALDAGEVATLAALAARGFSVKDMLEEKVSPPNDQIPFQNYAYGTYGDATNPEELMRPYRKQFVKQAAELLGFKAKQEGDDVNRSQ